MKKKIINLFSISQVIPVSSSHTQFVIVFEK